MSAGDRIYVVQTVDVLKYFIRDTLAWSMDVCQEM